jgi:hypothetical protein
MKRLITAFAFLAASLPLCAQGFDGQDIQIHGFATQGFLVSNNNNYLGMNTRNGSAGWTEAAVNINDNVTNKLRAGIQLHYTRLGSFGGEDVSIDWAMGDYKINRYLGLRAGKVKIRWGLFNDTQDYDPGYMWSLLPESMYGIDTRATNLSQNGAEIYGRIPLGTRAGKLAYSFYYGNYTYSSDDGYIAQLNEAGYYFNSPPSGKSPGADLRWTTPIHGLMLGSSLMVYNAYGNMTNGTYKIPYTYWPAYYAEYNNRNFFSSGQYMRYVTYQIVTVTGYAPVTQGADVRGWFVMCGYHFNNKFEAGAYYTALTTPSAGDNSNPANFYKDWVVSSRYDFNSNFYAKLEGHFMDGNAVGFYPFNNPNRYKPKTALAVFKIGFTF